MSSNRNPVSLRSRRSLLPAAGLALVLFLEPADQRLEIIDDRGGVDLPRAGELLERVGPGLAAAQGQHLAKLLARLLAAEHGALVQRPLETGCLAQRPVKLELQDVRQE